jgi:carboxypeptidase C (cathepsin A)
MNLTFVTVKNAGHMVPRDQPQAAYEMLEAFLAGRDLPDKVQF